MNFWPQKNIYLYEYRDGIVYNRPNFDYVFSFLPRKLSKEQRDFRSFIEIGLEEDEKTRLSGIIGERKRDQLSRRIVTNSRGQRDNVDHDYSRGGGLRIVNLGDSMGFGWPVALEDSYVKVLERNLKGGEVVNCALINANTPVLLKIYEKDCSRYDPDIVILQMTIAKEGANPDFLFLDKFGPDFIETSILLRYRTMERRGNKEKDDGIIQRELSPKLPFYAKFDLARLIGNLFIDVRGRAVNFYSLASFLHLDESADEVAISFGHVEKLKKEVEKNGAKLVVVMVPNLDGFFFSKIRERDDWQRFKELLSENNYDFIDFSKIFESYDADEIFMENEFHPNEKGYRLMGEEMATYIREKYLINENT